MDLVSYGNILSKLFPGYYIEFFEDKRIILPNYNSYNFIRILDKDPCFVNRIFYILFTIIPIVEIYKCYINSYIYEKKFIIRKLISTRYDLNQDKYKVFNPHINFLGQEYSFDSIDYNYININHELKSPTENEINVASQFNKKIPKYECESLININDENKIGIIKDDPNYREKNNGIFCYLKWDFSKIEDKINNNIDDNLIKNTNNNKVYVYNGIDSKENLNMNADLGNININNLNLNNSIKSKDENKNFNENDIINSKSKL